MKKITAFIFCVLLLFSMSGQFIVFKSIQYSVKKEIKRKIKNTVPADELHYISLSKSDAEKKLNWLEEDKEFIFNGRMYDVVKVVADADTLHFYCINDEQEEKLFAGLEELVQKEMNATKTEKKVSVKKAVTDYFHHEKEVHFCATTIQSFNMHSIFNKGFFVVSELLQPPDFA